MKIDKTEKDLKIIADCEEYYGEKFKEIVQRRKDTLKSDEANPDIQFKLLYKDFWNVLRHEFFQAQKLIDTLKRLIYLQDKHIVIQNRCLILQEDNNNLIAFLKEKGLIEGFQAYTQDKINDELNKQIISISDIHKIRNLCKRGI